MGGFFDSLKEFGNDIKKGAKQFQNKKFMEAVASSAALVALANGTIKSEEKDKVLGAVRRNENLQHFDAKAFMLVFQGILDDVEFDETIGKATAMEKIRKLKKGSDEALMAMKICCAIGAADGDFDDDEIKIVKEMAKEIGIKPKDLGL